MKVPSLGLALLLCSACSSSPPQLEIPESMADAVPLGAIAPPAEYRVGSGDALRVNVFGQPTLSSPARPVDGTGHIQMPAIGLVHVDGKTLFEIRETLTEALGRYLKEPLVDVAIVKFGSKRFIVLGEVPRPGAYVLDRPMSALEALTRAGGFAPGANREQLIWMRGGLAQENLVFLSGVALDARATELVHHGDVFYVGRREWADRAEVVRDIIPLMQSVTIPLSIATQFVTLERLLESD